MHALSLHDELHDARTRWLDGDADAWTQYIACCGHLERAATEVSPTRAAEAPAPRTVRQRTGRGTVRRRGRRAAASHS